MQQSDGLGNQQERREADLHWFGGLFDGEGCISILRGRSDRAHVQLNPCVRIVQSSETVVAEIKRLLTMMDVPFHIALHKPSHLGSKSVYWISMNGMKRSARFLAAFSPYLRGKKQDADIVAEFIASRMEPRADRRYTAHEVDLYIKLRELHGYRLRESSETIRKEIQADLRYSPTSDRKTESAAEMSAPAS